MCKMSFCEIWHLFSWAPMRHFFWCYYRWLTTSLSLKKCKKKSAICFKLFWYKVFVHWKLKLINSLTDSVLTAWPHMPSLFCSYIIIQFVCTKRFGQLIVFLWQLDCEAWSLKGNQLEKLLSTPGLSKFFPKIKTQTITSRVSVTKLWVGVNKMILGRPHPLHVKCTCRCDYISIV